MTKEQIKAVFDRALAWPPERQAQAAEILILLEAQGEMPLRLSDEEWAAIQEGDAEAERGEFASDEEMATLFRREGR